MLMYGFLVVDISCKYIVYNVGFDQHDIHIDYNEL